MDIYLIHHLLNKLLIHSLSKEEANKFETKLGCFLTFSVDTFLSNFVDIASKAQTKMVAKNDLIEKEVKELESELKDLDAGERKKKKKIETEITTKKKDVSERKKFHNKQLNDLVKKLAEMFIASGFVLPEQLKKKYENEFEEYPALKIGHACP